MSINRLILMVALCLTMTLIGCSGDDVKDGDLATGIEMPADTVIDLYCENMGVYPESCVLDDPNNPYLSVGISENVFEEDDEGNQVMASEGNKFELAKDAPSVKSEVYLWATALASGPSGENQFNTADAFHRLYTEGGSENARIQAIKGYQAVLDHFFNSATYYVADWVPGEPSYAVLLKDLVGARVYNASDVNLDPLYASPEFGLAALAEWGYALDVEDKTVSKVE